MEAVRLAPLVDETWAPLRERAEEKQQMAEISCVDDATVPGNPELWKHILSNLFSNAVDHTSEGGSIRFDYYQDGISLSNTVSELSIQDVGQMFERSWRADGSRRNSSLKDPGGSAGIATIPVIRVQPAKDMPDDGGRADGREPIIFLRGPTSNSPPPVSPAPRALSRSIGDLKRACLSPREAGPKNSPSEGRSITCGGDVKA